MEARLFHSILPKLRKYRISPECAQRLECESELECVIAALKRCKGLSVVQLAIDPGVTVGIVLLVDSVAVWSWEGSRKEALVTIKQLLETIEVDKVITSTQGLQLLPDSTNNVVLVDEHGTSKKRIKGMGKHASSAFLMATRNSISRRVKRRRGGLSWTTSA